VPEEKLGIVVLTNGPRTALPEALVWRGMDEWLGAPPRDWSASRLERTRAGRARAEQARRAQEATRDPSLPPPALEAYAGTYAMPLLGDLSVTLEGGEAGRPARAELEDVGSFERRLP